MKVFLLILFIILIVILFYFKIKKDKKDKKDKICIVSMIKNPKNIETWLKYHKDIGISKIYIRLEDTPDLNLDSDFIYVKVAKSTGINEYTDIQKRQNTWMNEAMELAKKDKMDWIIHIDSDELIDGNLDDIRKLKVDTFWMQNVEALYKDVPTPEDNCFQAVKFINCANGYCVSYANGKGGGRVIDRVKPHGPHRFISSLNNEVKLDNVFIKHFESCDFESYKNKFKHLSKQTNESIPFKYYNDSINAAKTGNDTDLINVYKKYRTI